MASARNTNVDKSVTLYNIGSALYYTLTMLGV